MKTCQDCGANNWQFKSQGGMTVATCRNCSHELRWARKRKSKLNNSEPDACNCGNKKFDRIKKVNTIEEYKIVLKLPHYCTHYFICTKCKKEYPDKTTKKNNIFYK